MISNIDPGWDELWSIKHKKGGRIAHIVKKCVFLQNEPQKHYTAIKQSLRYSIYTTVIILPSNFRQLLVDITLHSWICVWNNTVCTHYWISLISHFMPYNTNRMHLNRTFCHHIESLGSIQPINIRRVFSRARVMKVASRKHWFRPIFSFDAKKIRR